MLGLLNLQIDTFCSVHGGLHANWGFIKFSHKDVLKSVTAGLSQVGLGRVHSRQTS